ncbi:MAG TPA: hypothetical protein VIG30_12335 [Ktedonobacterales bacterium]|jgi:hypothetical protein
MKRTNQRRDVPRRTLYADGWHTITLWYVSVPLPQVLADIATIGPSLRGTAGMRVVTNHEEALAAVPALCASLGYACALVPKGDDIYNEGDPRPVGRYHFDIQTPG